MRWIATDAETFTNRWRRTIADHGLIGITWPKQYGGQDRSKLEQVVLAEEFAKAGVPSIGCPTRPR